MFVWKILFSLTIFSYSPIITRSETPRTPQINNSARVKQHRAGASGDLVAGEEHLRKIIISWGETPGAEIYEVCYMCEFNDEGDRDISVGKLSEVPVTNTCGGNPCFVHPGAFIGLNTYHLRVKVENEWSKWSDERTFEVGDVYGRVMDVNTPDEF